MIKYANLNKRKPLSIIFQFTNAELDFAKDEIVGTFEMMELAKKDPQDFNEIRVEQVCKVQNSEVVYGEYAAHVFFAIDDAWDPNVLQNDSSEETSLGSIANYRTKCLVSLRCLHPLHNKK